MSSVVVERNNHERLSAWDMRDIHANKPKEDSLQPLAEAPNFTFSENKKGFIHPVASSAPLSTNPKANLIKIQDGAIPGN